MKLLICVKVCFLKAHLLLSVSTVNKHKPWIETSYHGVITENTDVVLLDPPLVALDKDAPIPYAGRLHFTIHSVTWTNWPPLEASQQ